MKTPVHFLTQWFALKQRALPSPAPTVGPVPWRTFLRYRHRRSPAEQAAYERAFTVPGDALESQPQFFAVMLAAEALMSASDALTRTTLPEEQLREETGYRRALCALMDTLRKEWDAAHSSTQAPK